MFNNVIFFKYESKYFFNLVYCYVMKECFDKVFCFFNIVWVIDFNDNDCEKVVNFVILKIKY